MIWYVFQEIRLPVKTPGARSERSSLLAGTVEADTKEQALAIARRSRHGVLSVASRVSFDLTREEYAARRTRPYWCEVLPRGAVIVAAPDPEPDDDDDTNAPPKPPTGADLRTARRAAKRAVLIALARARLAALEGGP